MLLEKKEKEKKLIKLKNKLKELDNKKERINWLIKLKTATPKDLEDLEKEKEEIIIKIEKNTSF